MSRAAQLEIVAPGGPQTLLIPAGQRYERLSDLLRRHQHPLNTRCGQRGLCDGCIVELLAGQLVHVTTGDVVTAGTQPVSLRGCEYRLADGVDAVRIHIPPRSLLAYEPQIVSDFRVNVPRAHDPLWQQIEIADGSLDAAGLCRAVAAKCQRRRPVRLAADVKLRLPGRVTTEYRDDHWLITGIAAPPVASALGAAIDIGTTTVALLLVDLTTGQIVGRAADFNQQMQFGDDVLTRINLCATDPQMLRVLQQAVVADTVVPLLNKALAQAGAAADRLACVTVAANTTMLHLFAGDDPTPMGHAPFTATFLDHRMLPAGALPFPATVHLLPGAAAYVGADLSAGVLSSGLIYEDGPNLLVDVGTNGEIILKHGAKLSGCATAAGPAFEGAGLSCGMRAGDGAISDIRFTTEPFTIHTEMIGPPNGTRPAGFCGSAYVDFLAQGRRVGLLGPTGRFERIAGAPLIPWNDDETALRVADGQGKRPIVISEVDIAHLLQAKAAIAAGILTLLERNGLTPGDVKTLHLAGGFGMHIEPAHAIGSGLLPGFVPEQIQVVGNTALAGAYIALLDCGALDEIVRISRQIEIVELNLDPHFESRYIDQLALPPLAS